MLLLLRRAVTLKFTEVFARHPLVKGSVNCFSYTAACPDDFPAEREWRTDCPVHFRCRLLDVSPIQPYSHRVSSLVVRTGVHILDALVGVFIALGLRIFGCAWHERYTVDIFGILLFCCLEEMMFDEAAHNLLQRFYG